MQRDIIFLSLSLEKIYLQIRTAVARKLTTALHM